MTRLATALVPLALLLASPAHAAPSPLSPAETATIYKAAGFAHDRTGWSRCETEPGNYHDTELKLADLNGDGAPEAWVREMDALCYGVTGEAFVLLARKAGVWTPVLEDTGIAMVRKTRHLGWPDVEVGGPGMGPFPVYRFNGSKYVAR